MTEWSVLLLGFVAAACGCASMDRHGREIFGREETRSAARALYAAAWVFAAASYALAVAVQGVGIGSIEWICLFGLAAVAVAVLAAYRPRWLLRAGVTALAGAAGLALV